MGTLQVGANQRNMSSGQLNWSSSLIMRMLLYFRQIHHRPKSDLQTWRSAINSLSPQTGQAGQRQSWLSNLRAGESNWNCLHLTLIPGNVLLRLLTHSKSWVFLTGPFSPHLYSLWPCSCLIYFGIWCGPEARAKASQSSQVCSYVMMGACKDQGFGTSGHFLPLLNTDYSVLQRQCARPPHAHSAVYMQAHICRVTNWLVASHWELIGFLHASN